MAKYSVECPVCGSTYAVQLYGPGRDREWKLENWDWTCDDCKEKARQEENQKAAMANAEAGLPPLTGSEKQVPWAETIRSEKFNYLQKTKQDKLEYLHREAFYGSYDALPINDPHWDYAVSLLTAQTAASWWIDNRDIKIGIILKQLFVNNPPAIPEPEEIKEAKNEALIEATVRPEKPITETVAEIRAGDKFVEVIFPEKREDFRQLVRFKLGYKWTETRWRRDLKPINGTPHDRAAELGNCLLAAGFPIRIFDDTLRVHAVFGSYERESKRWIMVRTTGQYNGWFVINWPRDEDFYKSAKRLRGARYDKPFVVVPAEQFQEVLDFADMYQFSISDGARKVVQTAHTVRANALTASVTPPKKEKLPEPGEKPTPLNVPENVDIADEFKEGE